MSHIVNRNDKLSVYVEDLTHDGAGVAKVQGYPIFIPGALPGEEVHILVEKTMKRYGFGKLLEVIQQSPDRVKPPCHVFSECGGCQLQHLSYEGQLKQKQKNVQDVMQRIGKIPNVTVHPVIGMDNPWRYRNKSQIPFSERDGEVVSGFYKSRTHYIVDTDICLIQGEEADELMTTLKNELHSMGIVAYDEHKHSGMLRHLIVRKARATGELMVVLVTRAKKFPQKNAVIELIKRVVPNVTSIMQNVNSEKTNVIFGEETILLDGKSFIVDSIGNISFEISARSFYQVNSEQTEVLYKEALKYAQLSGNESVIDAYCGIGTISLFLAQNAKEVYGVEIVPEAIEDARRNAELNGITNAQFEAGAAEDVIPKLYAEGKRFDVLVVDPPRKGCDEKLLNTILEYKPKRIVYVSCDPATLARDLRILEDGGYYTQEIQPVDMFPHSSHVECVAWLEFSK